jgi:deoxyribodipyrimidine photo-lyase
MILFWFRRDLRLQDNSGLYQALAAAKAQNTKVLPVFIFDSTILNALNDKKDARLNFIFDTITALKQELQAFGSDLLVLHGQPLQIWTALSEKIDNQASKINNQASKINNQASKINFSALYFNRDYEPYAKTRDQAVHLQLKTVGISTHSFKDHVVFEKLEVTKADNSPYLVFTPYSKRWRAKLEESRKTETNDITTVVTDALSPKPTETLFDYFLAAKSEEFATILADYPAPNLSDLGFQLSDIKIPAKNIDNQLIIAYKERRDTPAFRRGTSLLGLHLRFGTLSIRQLAQISEKLSDTFLNELIWRDFYAMILDNFPHVMGQSFRPEYDKIQWRNDSHDFEAWKAGKTGYPLVDAGMRQLNQTGFMHNRVRMVVASFLCKHLLIDWRWGEAYFAEKLLDFDLSSNNGGWQWAAGSGTDAAPYFRIFNPQAQQVKFDKDFEYIRRWVPEYGTTKYAAPIVVHEFARARCLEVYKAALKTTANKENS